MGLTFETLDFLRKHVPSIKNLSICDLGAQQFKVCSPFPEDQYCSKYYLENGVKRYMSIDLNGEDISCKYDLCSPLPENLKGEFDCVFNFGTSEHVVNLYWCLRNVHNICKVNGIMLHVVPAPNNWPGHGYHYVDIGFFEQLAEKMNYKLLECFRRPCSFGGTSPSVLTHAALMKQNESEFISEDTFKSLPIFTK